MGSIIHTSITGQEILSSPVLKQDGICICYAVGNIGTVWLSPKEVTEIQNMGAQAVCQLVASTQESPEKRVWALTSVLLPEDTTQTSTGARVTSYSSLTKRLAGEFQIGSTIES
jgi:hypothetical protein